MATAIVPFPGYYLVIKTLQVVDYLYLSYELLAFLQPSIKVLWQRYEFLLVSC